MELIAIISLFLFGAVFGSFAMCQVWRMRAEQEEEIDHKTTEKVKLLREMRKGKKGFKKLAADRSICLHCGYQLAWYDNIPILSWLLLRGKCRKCHQPIGFAEIACEIGLGAMFVLSYLFFPIKLVDYRAAALLFIFLASLVGFLMLFVYDAKYRRLPEKPLTFCIICATLFLGVRYWGLLDTPAIFELLGALAVLPGLYFILYKLSKERLVGSGDYLLSIPIALMTGAIIPAFFVLFLANLLGSVVMFPVVLHRRKHGLTAQISFGPFLIIGFLLVFFLQNYLTTLTL